MRHDAHYVEELSGYPNATIGRLVNVDLIDPNPEQPRVELGDLTDLVSSIKEKGVLEPLLVKPSSLRGRWMIIAGERRWRASKIAGLKEVPCIEMDVHEGEVAEIALIENLQRKDLTSWEEADGLAALREKYGYTHDDVAKKIGKSRTTVTEALAIASLPEVIRELCRHADINAKSTLLEIVRQPDDDSMHRLVNEIIHRDLSREGVRRVRRSKQETEGRKAPATSGKFTYKSSNGDFKVEVFFTRSEIEWKDIENALQEALGSLEKRTTDAG